ncbi:DUF2510 domain-containing protein [Agromyces badenianii]|uniref:DUF2510 domain-containing protein n=1 Tax=Agromyces badenianii TaxID=2080742 RepID=UPI000D595E2C|nr:DUF2510 domain-containing protein [Agromyces badenianii]PWC05241.1 hypothetical protein DCE94_02780 [Agromyces badenianii]
MSDPTRAPAGWYEDGTGGRRYWDGDAWTQYVAPGPETVPSSQLGPESAITEVLPTGGDGPTIPFVWGSQGSDAAGYAYGDAPTTPYPTTTPAAPAAPYAATAPTTPYAVALGHPDATTESYGAPSTKVLPGHPFTEPSNPGPNVVGIIALVIAVVGLVFAFIPAVSGVAWILVPVAFVLSIVGLFLRGAKWPAVTGLIVSIIAAVVGLVMFVAFLIGSVGNAIDDIDEAIPDVPALPLPDPVPEQPEAPVAGDLAFGETMTWDDGVALTVSVPEPYTPSDFAVGATQASNVVFTLTITNNSTADLQPLPLPTVSSGDQSVSQIFDIGSDVFASGDDVGFPPTATIEPGGSVSWRAAWSVDDAGSLTLQVAPSLLHPATTFTNVP